MEDEKIIDLYFDRNEEAIRETDQKYGKACLHLSVNILDDRSDAEECVNDTYFAAWNTIPPARPSPLLSFLLRITRNLSVSRYRTNSAAKRNHRYDLSYEELEGCIGECSFQSDRQLPSLLEAFLCSVSKENRVIFLRRYWFFDDYAQISRRTGLSEKVISIKLITGRTVSYTSLRTGAGFSNPDTIKNPEAAEATLLFRSECNYRVSENPVISTLFHSCQHGVFIY